MQIDVPWDSPLGGNLRIRLLYQSFMKQLALYIPSDELQNVLIALGRTSITVGLSYNAVVQEIEDNDLLTSTSRHTRAARNLLQEYATEAFHKHLTEMLDLEGQEAVYRIFLIMELPFLSFTEEEVARHKTHIIKMIGDGGNRERGYSFRPNSARMKRTMRYAQCGILNFADDEIMPLHWAEALKAFLPEFLTRKFRWNLFNGVESKFNILLNSSELIQREKL